MDSEIAEEAAREAWMQASKPLNALVSGLVDVYFASFAARSKKAEYEEAQRLDIYAGNYRSFLKGRSEGKTLGQVCYGLRNQAWISPLAGAHGRRQELESLVDTQKQKRAAWESAAKQVVRWPLEPPK